MEPQERLLHWSHRAEAYGVRAVDLRVDEQDFARWTESRWQILKPFIVHRRMSVPEWTLDFGCGAGRFSTRLAGLLATNVIGYDPCPELLDLARTAIPHPRVSYTAALGPALTEAFDYVFCAYVLGGLLEPDLSAAIATLARVMRPGAELFLVENSRPILDTGWRSRPADFYVPAFAAVGVTLSVLGHYDEFGCELTIYAGVRA